MPCVIKICSDLQLVCQPAPVHAGLLIVCIYTGWSEGNIIILSLWPETRVLRVTGLLHMILMASSYAMCDKNPPV